MANPRLLLELVKMLSGGEDTAKKAPPSRIDPESRGPGPTPYFENLAQKDRQSSPLMQNEDSLLSFNNF